MTTMSYDLTFLKVTKLKRLTNYLSWRMLIKYSLMSAELWDLIIESDVEFSLKLDVSSQSVMTEEFVFKIIIITSTVLINITWANWITQNNKITVIIIFIVSSEITVIIDNIKIVKEM